MASFMRVPFIFVFHQSKCISAIKRIIYYYRHVYIFVFFHVFVRSLSLRCMLKSIARCVWEGRRCTIYCEDLDNNPDVSNQWRTQKIFMGGFIQWHMVVIYIWCALFVTSHFDVIFMFPNQRFREIC